MNKDPHTLIQPTAGNTGVLSHRI